MEKANCGGQMAKNILEISRRTNDMGKASSSGGMVENTKANGSKASSTVLASIGMPKARSERASGLRARELSGFDNADTRYIHFLYVNT